MRWWITAWLTSLSMHASNDEICRIALTQLLPLDQEKISALYDYKNNNYHRWEKT